MSLPDLKALAELAKTCRKSGIKQFKCAELEFTLTDDIPVSNYRRKAELGAEVSPVPTDSLTDEQLLMWSVSAREEGNEQ